MSNTANTPNSSGFPQEIQTRNQQIIPNQHAVRTPNLLQPTDTGLEVDTGHHFCDCGCWDKITSDEIDFEAIFYRDSRLREFMEHVLGDSDAACWWKIKAPQWLDFEYHFRSRRGSLTDLAPYLDAANVCGNEIRFSLVPLEQKAQRKMKAGKNKSSSKISEAVGWVKMPMRTFAIEFTGLNQEEIEEAVREATKICFSIGFPYCHFVGCNHSATIYWSCSDGVSIPLWIKIQTRLVEILGADSSCASPQKEWHLPFMVEWLGAKTKTEAEDGDIEAYFLIESIVSNARPYSLESIMKILGVEVENG